MATLNPGYYNNTSCQPGSVQMPDSSANPVILNPVCNPIDRELINTIMSYLISNDMFILNQQTETQQTPGQFNISNYGKALSFMAKNFYLLDNTGQSKGDLKLKYKTINSLGDYYGPQWSTTEDYIIEQSNIVLDGQIVLPTDLPSTQNEVILTIDGNGIVNETLQSNITTKIPTLQEVTSAGNSTSTTITQQEATNDNELVTYGQMVTSIADLLLMTPEIVQIILDYLDTSDFTQYIPMTQKAVQGGVQSLGLDGKLPIGQAPALTLQQICNNGSVTTTTISAAPATLGSHLVTLNQLTALVNSTVPDLDAVLTAGSTSTLGVLLTSSDQTTEITPRSLVLTYTSGSDVDHIDLDGKFIKFYKTGTTYNNEVHLFVSRNTDLHPDRLLVNDGSSEGYILTTLDSGHAPTTGISINADLLDGVHQSAFILNSQFPIDLTGQVTGNALIFNGTNWVPGTISGGGTTLTYFTESLSGTMATWQATSGSNSLFFKTNIHKNINFGSIAASSTGTDNFIYSNTSPGVQVSGNYNTVFANNGTVNGMMNTVFSDTVNIGLNSNYNFIFDSDMQVGTSTAALYNVIFGSTTDATSANQYAGSRSNLFNNVNTKYLTTNAANSSFLANNENLQLSSSDVIALKTYASSINGIYSTLINATNVTIAAQRAFASGNNLTLNSFANTAFGTFGTVESGGTSNAVVDRDRQFFIGSGSSLGNLRNAITIWKSGAAQLQGVLRLGSQTANETNAIIEGSIRYNDSDKAIEIYRSAAWSKDLQNNSVTDYIAWSKIKYPAAQTPTTETLVGSSTPLLINPGTIDLSTGPYAVTIVDGVIAVETAGYYHIHFNIGIHIDTLTSSDVVTLKLIGNNVTQNLTLSQTVPFSGESQLMFNGSLFAKLEDGDTLGFYLSITGVQSHDVTPLPENSLVDFIEVKNIQDGVIEDNTLGWIDNLRQIYIRNTSLNNVNLSGETKFRVVSHVLGTKTITLDQDIPTEVDGIPFDPTKKWALTKGYLNCVDINTIDVTRRIITYTGLTGTINALDYVEFFNPFMNYKISVGSPILTNGLSGSWNETYMQSGGMWQKDDGTYSQLISGLSVPGGTLRIGKASSLDQLTWSLDNGGNYIFGPGIQPFNNSFESTHIYTQANPVKTQDNTYISIYAAYNGTIGRIGWMEFDEDANIIAKSTSPISVPGYTADIFQVGGVIYFQNKWLLYVPYRPSSTPSTWKILEIEMDDIKSGVVTTVREVMAGAPGGYVWNSQHMDSVIPFIYNGVVKLWVGGTGPSSDPGSLYLFSGNRSYGLVHRNVSGSTVSFTVDTRNPIFSNPVNGTTIWGYSEYWDHIGGGLSHFTEGQTMYMYPTFNAGSNTYKVAAITMDNSI